MESSIKIENAIAEVTGAGQSAIGSQQSAMAWIYGQMVWSEIPAFRFVACRGRETREINLMADQVTRYRDGETAFFLIELPAAMANALDLDGLVLTSDELDRLKRHIDTSRKW